MLDLLQNLWRWVAIRMNGKDRPNLPETGQERDEIRCEIQDFCNVLADIGNRIDIVFKHITNLRNDRRRLRRTDIAQVQLRPIFEHFQDLFTTHLQPMEREIVRDRHLFHDGQG